MSSITRSAMTGASLIALLLSLDRPAGAQVTIELPPKQEDEDRPGRSGRAGGVAEFQELRRLLEQERDSRRQAEERLADREEVILELVEKLARAQAEADELGQVARRAMESLGEAQDELDQHREHDGHARGDRPSDGHDHAEAPDRARVAEARVEAARSRLEAAEVRLDACRQRVEEIDRAMASGIASAAEGFEGRMALADAQAQLAEARAQLVESEFQLGRVLRGQDGEPGSEEDRDEAGHAPGEVDIDDEGDGGIALEDVVDTADRIIDLIRSLDDDDRGRPYRGRMEEEFELEIEVEEDVVDEVFDTAERIIDLIQGFRRDRRGR